MATEVKRDHMAGPVAQRLDSGDRTGPGIASHDLVEGR